MNEEGVRPQLEGKMLGKKAGKGGAGKGQAGSPFPPLISHPHPEGKRLLLLSSSGGGEELESRVSSREGGEETPLSMERKWSLHAQK